MAENITITANWLDGSLSNGMISRQYDNNRYRVQFINYPLGEDEDLSLYLIVWMKTEENGQSVEQAPIELDSDQWIITNYYTQFVQNIQFQLCVRNESGTFEAHSPIFNSNVIKSLSHDGSTQEIYVDPLFDAYKEYVDDLVIGAGAVVIDSDLDTAGAAADAKATGDAVAELNEHLVDVKNDFDEITESYQPTDYTTNVSASDLVIGSSALAGKITATDNPNGGIDVVNEPNSSNGYIGFLLEDLPYNSDKVVDFTVELANAVGTVELYLRRGMSAGSVGTTVQTFSADTDGKYKASRDFSNYNYSIHGNLYLCYRIYSSQTTAVNIRITAIEQGAEPNTIIKTDAISGLDMENLSSELQNKIQSINTLSDEVGNLTEEHVPTDYTSGIGTDDIVIGTSALSGKITATDNPNGGIDVVNSSGVNGTIGFALDNVPYDTQKKVVFTVELTSAASPVTLDIRRSMSEGAIGAVIQTFALDTDGKYRTVFDFGKYPYGTGGKLYIGYNIRYSQTTAVNLKITAIEQGDAEKQIYKNDMIMNIGFDNLGQDLYDHISVVSGEKPTLYGGKQISVFNKGVAIGDSLTAGVFNRNDGGSMAYSTIAAYSYPAKLAQLTGIDVINLGNGGYTSDQWWDAHENDDLSGYQFAIIQLGVNDAIQYADWTQTSITAFTNIINKILSENTGCFVFVSTVIPATSYRGTAYNAVSEGIRNLIQSIDNDHVILLDMANYGNTADEAGYNNGHLSALGYERLALDYISYISYAIAQNPVLFRNIQFIGTNHSYN